MAASNYSLVAGSKFDGKGQARLVFDILESKTEPVTIAVIASALEANRLQDPADGDAHRGVLRVRLQEVRHRRRVHPGRRRGRGDGRSVTSRRGGEKSPLRARMKIVHRTVHYFVYIRANVWYNLYIKSIMLIPT